MTPLMASDVDGETRTAVILNGNGKVGNISI